MAECFDGATEEDVLKEEVPGGISGNTELWTNGVVSASCVGLFEDVKVAPTLKSASPTWTSGTQTATRRKA